jgi:hypothetical protein
VTVATVTPSLLFGLPAGSLSTFSLYHSCCTEVWRLSVEKKKALLDNDWFQDQGAEDATGSDLVPMCYLSRDGKLWAEVHRGIC